jgi:carboxymethylenebutenolidase
MAWVTLNVDQTPMATYVATPDGPGPFPAIVFAQHIGGVDDTTEQYCDRLAAAGFVTVCPDLYHRQDKAIPFEDVYSASEDVLRVRDLVVGKARSLKSTLKDDEMVRDMEAAADYVTSLSANKNSRIGVVGFCMGGRVAYLVATRSNRYSATAVAFPSGLFKGEGDNPSPFDKSSDITTPMLGLFGAEDHDPSLEQAKRVDAQLTALGIEHSFHYYEGAGHGFMNPHNHDHYHAHAAESAWSELLQFLPERLGVD